MTAAGLINASGPRLIVLVVDTKSESESYVSDIIVMMDTVSSRYFAMLIDRSPSESESH